MTDDEKCERCNRSFPEARMDTISIDKERRVCDGCVLTLSEDIDYYDWRNRYTEKQHTRAVSLLEERDDIECVIHSYEKGQIIVHTSYVSSAVITDFCTHFGLQIVAFGPEWYHESDWKCMEDHNDIFQIVLEYNHNSDQPIPLNVELEEIDIEELDGNDEQF